MCVQSGRRSPCSALDLQENLLCILCHNGSAAYTAQREITCSDREEERKYMQGHVFWLQEAAEGLFELKFMPAHHCAVGGHLLSRSSKTGPRRPQQC
jgi:hypothetical protein